MAGKRRYQWIDAFQDGVTTVTTGAIVNQTVVSEAELENVGGAATLIRVVGTILPLAAATASARGVFVLFVLQTYGGAVAPTVWNNDTFQRKQNLGSWFWRDAGIASQPGIPRVISIDLRTKRKLGQGEAITLATQNSGSGQSLSFSFHIRALLLIG